MNYRLSLCNRIVNYHVLGLQLVEACLRLVHLSDADSPGLVEICPTIQVQRLEKVARGGEVVWSSHIARVRINRVRLPILLVVS